MIISYSGTIEKGTRLRVSKENCRSKKKKDYVPAVGHSDTEIASERMFYAECLLEVKSSKLKSAHIIV